MSAFLTRLEVKIDEAATLEADFIIGGGAKDFEDYRERTGFLRGLMEARRLAALVDAEITGVREHGASMP